MKKQVLFIHGGGEGAYEGDKKLAASLRDALGTAYNVRYPKMPDEERPEYEAWKDQIAEELAGLDSEVILVGHSLGASILLKYLSEEKTENPLPGYSSSHHPTGEPRTGKSASTRCERTLRRDSPKSCRCHFTIAVMTNGCPLHTSRCTQ
jgi:Alpha/beta hydrolase family